MQKIAAAVAIHMPSLAEFCNQANGRAYIFEACETGEHFRHWYLYLTAFDQWNTPIMLTIDGGGCFIGDTGNAERLKEGLKAKRAKAEEMLRDKEITIFGGCIGSAGAKMIGDL